MPRLAARSAGHWPLCRLDQPFLKFSHTDLGEHPWCLGLKGLCLENKTLQRYSEQSWVKKLSSQHWLLTQAATLVRLFSHSLTDSSLAEDGLPANASSSPAAPWWDPSPSHVGECTFRALKVKQERCDKKTKITKNQNALGKHKQSIRYTNEKNRWHFAVWSNACGGNFHFITLVYQTFIFGCVTDDTQLKGIWLLF